MITKEATVEISTEHQKFDESILQKKIARYDKITRFVCLGMGIFSLLVMALITFAYFFIGLCRFFDLSFSLPSIAAWLDSLPEIETNHPEALLAKFIISGIFFIVYVCIAVLIIKKLIKIINCFTSLCDLNNSRIDHKKVLLEIVFSVSSATELAMSLTLLGLTTNGIMPPIAIVTIIAFAVLFLAFCFCKNFYTSYDVAKAKFYKNTFAINLVKPISVLLLTSLILALTFSPNLLTFVNNIIQNYINSSNYTGVAVFIKYFLPFIRWFLVLTCSFLLTQLINPFKQNMVSNFNFYDSTIATSPELNYQEKLNSKVKTIITFSIILMIATLIFSCFNAKNEFILPKNFGAIFKQTFMYYLSIILLAISVKVISKTKTKEIIPFLSNKSN